MLWRVVLITGVALVLVLAVNNQLSVFAQKTKSNERILSEKLVDLNTDGRLEKIVKIKRDNSIVVRVLELLKKGTTVIQVTSGEFVFANSDEGFVKLKQGLVSLTFEDVDHNGQKDILVSTFDKLRKKSLLHTLSWKKQKRKLELIKEEF